MATRNRRRDLQKEAYWRKQVSAWEKSGLRVADFCRRKKLVKGTFNWWRQEIRRRNAEKKQSGRGRVRFAALEIPGSSLGSEALGVGEVEVRLLGGARVRFRSDLGAEDLLRVLGALEGVRC